MVGWNPTRIAGGLAVGVVIFLAGCSQDPAAPEALVELTPAEIDEINIAFEDDADLSIGALFHGGSINAFDRPGHSPMGPPDRHPRFGPDVACLVMEPLPPADPDGDGIPTLFTIRFEPDPCVFRLGRTAIEFSGKLIVTDPVPDVAGYDLGELIEDFGVAHVLPNGRARAMMRTGARDVLHDNGTDQLIATERVLTSHTTPGRAFKDATVNWQLIFSGDDDIVFDQPFPSGNLTLEGTWSYSTPAGVRAFEVTTLTPLQYDALCADARPVRRFSEGVIEKTLMRNGVKVGVITVTWTGCGVPPTREVVRADGTRDRPGLR
jgi:hypothetical protein